ncbi:MDH1B [Symbiodinium natans]|uniref:MDH1B protein n=1 Tax=Symbiodinium natans TaxID=878477 RepID=A0A812I2I5_9DINO|nr:MDH1B [Symbiodinium natans]
MRRFPLEFLFERCLKEKEKEAETLPVFPFQHLLMSIPAPGVADSKPSPLEFAKSAASTYDTALIKLNGARQGGSRLLAFTTTWMLVAELSPPDVGSPEHEVWLRLPPPHPCALCGFVICPPVESCFPETAGGQLSQNKLVSNRAEEEGIAADAPDFEQLAKQVRISSQIYTRPAETVGYWVKK